MAEFPALPFFTDAYLADTIHLTTTQHGAYLLLLMAAWRTNDCALPNDDEFLARITRMDKRTWATNRAAVLSFWVLGDDGKLRQGRLSDERKYVEVKRDRNSQAGKASALKRQSRGSTTVQPNGNINPTPTPTPTPETTNVVSPPLFAEMAEKKPKTADQFKNFKASYPRRAGDQGWKAAEKKFDALVKRGVDAERIVAGAKAYRASCEERNRTGTEFVKQAITWLNQEGWADEYVSGAPPPVNGAQGQFTNSQLERMLGCPEGTLSQPQSNRTKPY
jgi:uncharacterized protein YdaU (DUF1376 family)